MTHRIRYMAAAAAFGIAALPGLAAAQAQPAPAAKDIVTVAVEAGSFETLVAAVKAAGLVETLQGPGPFTVFAPTDEAFAKLPAGTVEALLKDPAALRSVLTYHVVPGRVMAADVVRSNGGMPATVQGQSLTIRVVDGKVMVDGATVVTADVGASNGVIHVIDTVVLPKPAGGK
ncbi:MAG TPA: fasciclin domain-containing protein [Longimicrobiales bacterium]|nr:fasciclin domain-containing protein [Longimicrobiales bacterium]